MAGSAPPGADEVAAALRADPIFVADGAERELTDAEVVSLRAEIAEASTPVFVAVLPEASLGAGDADDLTAAIVEATGEQGTYALVVGNSFRAASTELRSGQAGDLATVALDAHRNDGTAAVLIDFVDRVDAAAQTTTGGSTSGQAGTEVATDRPSSDDGGIGAGAWLLGGAVLVAGVLLWRRRKRQQAEAVEQAREDEADRQLLRAELSVLADDVVRLEPDVQLHPDAQSDFDAAVNRYRAAQAALEAADERIDLVRVRRVVEEAQYSMDRARARMDGRVPPAPPAELQRPGKHGEPAIALDERAEPMYVGYPGGFGGGWYGAGGGLFTGMLLGSMLGGGWGFGGYGGTTVINNYPDGGSGDGGGGDFGGGDFGGGDFGGGDFGGGDFGGGDF